MNEYRLVPQPAQMIRDVYFDTPDIALTKARWALRTREIDGRQWITLKGPAISMDMGGVRRVEFELPWSSAALKEVMGQLKIHCLNPGKSDNFSAQLHPIDALRELGFHMLQERETSRRIRDIVSLNGGRVAEMVLDTVAYRVRARQILHEEIEIEAKSPDGPAAIRAVLDHLVHEFGSQLRKWNFGKLATGIALEKLLEKCGNADLIAVDGHLNPTAYDNLAILIA